MLKDLVSPDSTATENTCAGCGASIKDRYYLLAADKAWHGHCLRCSRCSQPLDTELSCFCRGGNIYCKDCRIFSTRQCAKCSQVLRCDDLVMRARDLIFHLNCFCCTLCKVPLNSGDTAALQDGQLYCGEHVEELSQMQMHDKEASHSFYCASPQKGRPRKRKCSPHTPTEIGLTLTHPSLLMLDHGGGHMRGAPEVGADSRLDIGNIDHQSNLLDVSSYDGSNHSPTSGGCMTPHSRAKRMRTSFKHNQLRSMKSYFAINQNPDAKDLKNLAQKTGLSKRVLQVWFQNARAKWRRNMLRQEQQQNGGVLGNKSVMGLMLPNLSSLTSSMIAENCHLLRNSAPIDSAANGAAGTGGGGDHNDQMHLDTSPSQTSSLDDIHHMTFAELY